ncbi:hypothetical protein Y032_0251g196 [Ancylostoma ceylanicum]|uniref:Phlebovirus glycoprotein G2 fusion domain-containing protein n=1 Tax=Ancylostoma ceylanicum TaxID=53326 RepID=A0A016SCW0_9BILA|nr:hypothetical protein Y032_0251g196 [Ancylostoma ceylanicum]
MRLHVVLIVSSLAVFSLVEALVCHAQTEEKLPDGSFKCVEFPSKSKGNEKEEFCASVSRARHGYLFPDSAMSMSSNCTETKGKKLCYCNPSDNCNSIHWIQKLIPEFAKCPEKWDSSLKYHTTGTSYWMKFMNSDPSEARDVKLAAKEIKFKSLGLHPTPSLYFTTKRQEEIYNISSLVLVLVCLFSIAYVTVTVIWNILATKEMFSAMSQE